MEHLIAKVTFLVVSGCTVLGNVSEMKIGSGGEGPSITVF